MNTNTDYWEKIVKNPSPAYKVLLDKEDQYLHNEIDNGSKVLDIGCGGGRTILSILDITSDIVGIDSDIKAVELARINLKENPNIIVQQADAKKIPFEDKTFDVATLVVTLVNFGENKQKTLLEMARVLKDDGKIIVSVYAETAIEERLAMYKEVGVPIKKVEGGYVTFDEGIGAHTSEQFSEKELDKLVEGAGLKIIRSEKVGELAYICTFKKL